MQSMIHLNKLFPFRLQSRTNIITSQLILDKRESTVALAYESY